MSNDEALFGMGLRLFVVGFSHFDTKSNHKLYYILYIQEGTVQYIKFCVHNTLISPVPLQ